jgi:hypothetical protein
MRRPMARETAVRHSDTDLRAERPPGRRRKEHASGRGDIEAEHAIQAADAMLDHPQSGERFRGRETTRRASGRPALHPPARHRPRACMGERMRHHLRRCAFVLGERHGIRRPAGRARDAVLRRSFQRARVAGRARRAGAWDRLSRRPDWPRPARPACRISAIVCARRIPPGLRRPCRRLRCAWCGSVPGRLPA